jgi:hydrogenase/urease accessory protein HupE
MIKHLILLLFFIAGIERTFAHQVDAVEMELLQVDGEWRLVGLLDVGYMIPGERGNPNAPPRFREDVMKLSAEELRKIADHSEATMRQMLVLKYNGEVMSWRIRFPDFEKQHISLPDDPGGWALLSAVISIDRQPGPGKLEASWQDDQGSELIIEITEGIEGRVFSVPYGTSETLLHVAAGEEMEDGTTQSVVTLPSRFAQAKSWLFSGYLHVVPFGLDHLLFILGLFLLAPRWRPLLGQSLLFTLAHSITLVLTVLGFITLPDKLVEIIIAASIAWIGIENLIVKDLKRARLIVVFCFGLLHGMGFAGVLMEKIGDLSGNEVILPLVSFNIGVELAQVSVIIVAFLLLMPFRKWTKEIRFGGSILIALAGLFWMGERIFA